MSEFDLEGDVNPQGGADFIATKNAADHWIVLSPWIKTLSGIDTMAMVSYPDGISGEARARHLAQQLNEISSREVTGGTAQVLMGDAEQLGEIEVEIEERKTSGPPAPWQDLSRRRIGEWRIIEDWIDADFGYVQLEWLDGVFVLWDIGQSSQSKILEQFHDEIFERKQVGA